MSSTQKLRRRQVIGMALASGVTLLSVPLRTIGQQIVRRTPSQILGPFYPVNKPAERDADLTTLAGRPARAQGQVIYLSGRVVNRLGEPVAGAQMEVWQANTHGKYRNPSDEHEAPLAPNFEGYALLVTDAAGRYSFKTIKPGAYPDDASGAQRAPHIHFDVTGRVNRLVTQMYFAGEPLNDTDRFLKTAGKNRGRLIVEFKPLPDDKETAMSANWDIVLHHG